MHLSHSLIFARDAYSFDGLMALLQSIVRYLRYLRNPSGLDKPAFLNYASQTIHKLLANDEARDRLGDERYFAIADEMMSEVVKVTASKTPFLTNRIKLASAVNELAQYLVLIVDPSPLPDATGFRGKEVSGQLKAHILELVRLKNYAGIWGLDATSIPTDEQALLAALNERYYGSRMKAEFYLALNAYLEDVMAELPDWYAPFVASACANKEHHYRCQLGLSSVLDPENARAEVIASEHHLFYVLVRNGIDDPLEAWEEIVAHIEYEDESHQMDTYRMYLAQYPI